MFSNYGPEFFPTSDQEQLVAFLQFVDTAFPPEEKVSGS